MDHLLQLPLGHHPGVFSVEVSFGINFFPARGKDERSMIKDLFFSLMTNLRSIMPILPFKSKDLCLGKEVDGFIAFYLFDESCSKGLEDWIPSRCRRTPLSSLPALSLSRSGKPRIPVPPAEETPSCRQALRPPPTLSFRPSVSLFEWAEIRFALSTAILIRAMAFSVANFG